jgi:hypothetical protein
VLHRVDRLPVFADEKPHVRSPHPPAQNPRVLLDLNLSVEAERIHDLLQQLLQDLGRLELVGEATRPVGLGPVHRRLPERFFFLRGGRGGGEEERAPATPASAGSPCGAPRGAPSALPSRAPAAGRPRASLGGGFGGGGM